MYNEKEIINPNTNKAMKRIRKVILISLLLIMGFTIGALVTIYTQKVYNHPNVKEAFEVKAFGQYFIYE